MRAAAAPTTWRLRRSFKRRYHQQLPVGITYTLMFYKRDTGVGSAGFGAMQLNNFDINTDWATAKDFQRHTFRANGVWTLPEGLLVLGVLRLRLAESQRTRPAPTSIRWRSARRASAAI